MFDISTVLIVGIVGLVTVPKMSTLETPRRELSECVSFGVSTLYVVEQWSWENPSAGVFYTLHAVVYDVNEELVWTTCTTAPWYQPFCRCRSWIKAKT